MVAIIDQFKRMLKDSCTIAPKSGQDSYGKPTYGDAVSYNGRWTQQFRMIRNAEGLEVMSTSNFRILGAPLVGLQDLITMSDGTKPTLASIKRTQDEKGNAASTVLFFL